MLDPVSFDPTSDEGKAFAVVLWWRRAPGHSSLSGVFFNPLREGLYQDQTLRNSSHEVYVLVRALI